MERKELWKTDPSISSGLIRHLNGVVLTEPWHEAGGTGGNAESGLAGKVGVCSGWRGTDRQAGRPRAGRGGSV